MQKSLIIFSLIIVCGLAFIDAKTRLDELKEVSAVTPSQMELKRELPKSTGDGLDNKKGNFPDPQTAYPKTLHTPPRQSAPQKLNLNFQESNTVNDVNTYSP